MILYLLETFSWFWIGCLSCNRFYFSVCSGGVKRDWIGVPRKLYSPGSRGTQCVCVRTTGPPWGQPDSSEHSDRGDLDNPHLEEYDGCHPLAEQCVLDVWLSTGSEGCGVLQWNVVLGVSASSSVHFHLCKGSDDNSMLRVASCGDGVERRKKHFSQITLLQAIFS